MARATKMSASWEFFGEINVDAATVGFGDPAVLGDRFLINENGLTLSSWKTIRTLSFSSRREKTVRCR